MVDKPRRGFASNQFVSSIELGIKFYERPTGSLLKAGLAEFIGTLIFIFIATGSVCFGCNLIDVATTSSASGTTSVPTDCLLNNSRVLSIATAFGVTLFAMVYAVAAFSGGHLNPAITLAFLLGRKISIFRACLYWACQLVGAIVGSAFVRAVDEPGFLAAQGATNHLLTGITPAAGWLMETILTFALVFVVFCANDSNRAQSTAHLPILAPLGIGFVVFADHLAAVAIDGCSVNPARSFGPAVIANTWDNHWIFWVGPFSGAIIATLVYELFFRLSQQPIMAVDNAEARIHPNQQPSAKLPGYSGVSGLDGATAAEREAFLQAEQTRQAALRDGATGAQASNHARMANMV